MSLPDGVYSPFTISYRDAGNEISSFSGYGATLTAANFVAKTALFTALVVQTALITLGDRTRASYGTDSILSGAQPTNGAARELKLLVQYRDVTTGEKMTATVPTLDPTIPTYVVNANARDVILIDAPALIDDFVSAFEAFVVNPRTQNAVTVYGLKVVGRRS